MNWSINSEGGFFNSSQSNSWQTDNLVLRLDGNFNYNYSKENISAFVKFKIRPEIYGTENSFKALKMKISANYSQQGDNLNWGTNLTAQKNFYKNNMADFSYSIFFLSLFSDLYQFENLTISPKAGYSYQTASENIELNLDFLFVEVSISKSFFKGNSIGAGFYFEKFTIENNYIERLTDQNNKNSGLRYGPVLSFNYLRQGAFQFEYRFLFHNSQVTKQPSVENWYRLLAGMIIEDYWSVFILADYYDRRFTLKQNDPLQNYLIYNPLDAENKVNLKLAREICESVELYAKAGYFKESYFDSKFDFEGWNILLGIDLSY